jgi:tetratricopeptide (TPR) repeat protein
VTEPRCASANPGDGAASVESLMRRGTEALQQGAFASAADSFAAAGALSPDNCDAVFSQGVALHSLNRHAEALACHERVLLLRPDHLGALIGQGQALERSGSLARSLASFELALQVDPHHPGALNNCGRMLARLGRLEQSLVCYDRLLCLDPRHVDALVNRALVLKKLERAGQSLDSYEAALAIDPRHRAALIGRGSVLATLQRVDEAIASFRIALTIDPSDVLALRNLGTALLQVGRAEEAEPLFQRILALAPDDLTAPVKLAAALSELNRPEEALQLCRNVLARDPGQVDAWCNAGAACGKLGRLPQAMEHYEKALSLEPGHAQALNNKSLLQLAMGDFKDGFLGQEIRWSTPLMKRGRLNTQAPLWLGDAPVRDKVVLLHHEQGFGDTVQFVRYAPLLAAMGARVVLRVPDPLRSLLASLDAGLHVVSDAEALPFHDFHCPMMSLPLAFRTTLNTVPGQVPYLRADAARVAYWRERLGRGERPRVGLAWAGRQHPPVVYARDMPLAKLQPLLAAAVDFISLQKGVRQGECMLLAGMPVRHFGEELADFADTAALLSNLDLLITVDTAIAHVAGALGKPVWLMNRYASCWRWLLQRSDSPWYPTMRLFRQPKFGDWDSVVADIGASLNPWCSGVTRTEDA